MYRNHAYPAKTRSAASLTALALATLLVSNAWAQVPVDANGQPLSDEYTPLDSGVMVENPAFDAQALRSAAELEALIGPIALYPDDLLAIVLPASTYPLEIVQAARFLESAKLDSSLKPDENWDDSIVALLNYPEILSMMNNDIDWTWQLGEAVVDQQSEVVSAIESFRDRAYAAGNLKSDDYQTVSIDEGVIEIEPVNEDIIYVPYYEPTQVVQYSARPVYHYYPDAYPVYFYPYANDWRFGRRSFWGVTTAFSIGWTSNRLHVLHPSFTGHPFFGHRYIGSYWRQPSITLFNNYYVGGRGLRPGNRHIIGDYWRPRHRVGPRPRYNRQVNRQINRRINRQQNRNAVARNLNRPNGLRDQRRRNGIAVGQRRSNPGIERRRTAEDLSRRSTRRNTGNNNRGSLRTASPSNDAIRFRARGNGAYSGTRETRMQTRERAQNATRSNRETGFAQSSKRRPGAERIAANRTKRSQAANTTRRIQTANTGSRQRNAARSPTRQRAAANTGSRRSAGNARVAPRQAVQRQSRKPTARAGASSRRSAVSRQATQRNAAPARRSSQKATRSAPRSNAKSSRSRGSKRRN